MAILQVRDVPEQLYRSLSQVAERERRSLTQQAIATLARGLEVAEDPKARRQRLLARIHARQHSLPPDRWPSPVDLVREDRER